MAIYTTLFLCKPDELISAFPGWKLPLKEPVRREIRNPFTKEVSIIETREPDWSDSSAVDPPQEYFVPSDTGNYAKYLESRLPGPIRKYPHWATTGLTSTEFGALFKAMGIPDSMNFPIYGPPTGGEVVQQFPSTFPFQLASLDQKDIAAKWAAILSKPDYTHSLSGEKISDGWKIDDALRLLEALQKLTSQAISGQQLYLLTEA